MIKVIYRNDTKTGCPRAKRCKTKEEAEKAMAWIAKMDYRLIRIDGMRELA